MVFTLRYENKYVKQHNLKNHARYVWYRTNKPTKMERIYKNTNYHYHLMRLKKYWPSLLHEDQQQPVECPLHPTDIVHPPLASQQLPIISNQ